MPRRDRIDLGSAAVWLLASKGKFNDREGSAESGQARDQTAMSSGRWQCAGGAGRGPFWVWISGRDAPSRGSPVTTDARERTLTMPPPPLWWASLDRPSLGSLALSDTTAATQRLTLATVCCAGEEIW